MILSAILIALIISAGAFAVVLYRYHASTALPNVMILQTPVSNATVGTPVEILANVTGPGRNVTLVYGQTAGTAVTQVIMNPVAKGEYSYLIPAAQVTGNVAYYIKAYDPAGEQVNTTVYHISVADFRLQLQTNTLTVYRTKTATIQLQLLSIDNFNRQVGLSTNGTPGGLTVRFSTNPAPAGIPVTLNVTADATAPNGTYPVTLIATYTPPQSPQVIRESVADITVADFQVAVTPASDVMNAGSTAAFTIILTLQKGFVNPVNITSVSGLPHGATYTLTVSNPTVLAGSPGNTEVTVLIKTVPSTKTGTYPIEIVISGGGVIHSLTAQIIVR